MANKNKSKPSFWDKFGELMLKSQTTSPASATGGDAYGARAMQAFSEGDVEKAKEIQREEDKQSTKALINGATFVGGGLSSKLLTDLAVTGLSTLADTAIEGNVNNLGKNLTLNAGLDLLGHGTFGALKKIGIQDVLAKIKHPTWQKYYHGSPKPFPIENARMGTDYDIGLHMTQDKDVAKRFARSNTGRVYEFYAPKPTLQTIDIHDNNITSLIGNRRYKAGKYQYTDASSRDKLFFDALDKYGGKDSYERYNGISAINLKDYYPLVIKKDFEIPMHEVVWPNRPKEAHEKLKKIYNSLPDTGLDDMAPKFANSEANEKAAKVLSDYGHKVLQYENHNPIEGLKTSYVLTDPKSMIVINKNNKDLTRPVITTIGAGLSGYGLYNTINSKKQDGKLKFQSGGKTQKYQNSSSLITSKPRENQSWNDYVNAWFELAGVSKPLGNINDKHQYNVPHYWGTEAGHIKMDNNIVRRILNYPPTYLSRFPESDTSVIQNELNKGAYIDWKFVNRPSVEDALNLVTDDYSNFQSQLGHKEEEYTYSPQSDDSELVKITAPNTDRAKYIFGQNISKNLINDIKVAAIERNQDPYDILAHILIEGGGTYNNAIRSHHYFNTHDVLQKQFPNKYIWQKFDKESILKNLGIYQDDQNYKYTFDQILKAGRKYDSERSKVLDNIIVPKSTADAVALHMQLHGRDFNPKQKGFTVGDGTYVPKKTIKHSYLDMIDDGIKSLKENMPDLFKNNVTNELKETK